MDNVTERSGCLREGAEGRDGDVRGCLAEDQGVGQEVGQRDGNVGEKRAHG